MPLRLRGVPSKNLIQAKTLGRIVYLPPQVREERLDKVIILNERHLPRTLREYVTYYNTRRPHQGLDQDSPGGLRPVSSQGSIRCRQVLGGIIQDYYREAA
jgi:putative transposase